jgi:cytochrome b6-f complex iron-sulfur subunit
MYALSAICTHLGCITGFLPRTINQSTEAAFTSGSISRRRPPRAREDRASDDGKLIDKGRLFKQEAGQWNDPESFLRLS